MITLPNYPIQDDLDDPRFRQLFDYWCSKFRDTGLPSRKDIDPLDIWPLMGHLNIIDVVQEGERVRYRYRLWGTYVTELYGRDNTGKFADEILIPTANSAIEAVLTEVRETRQPHFWQIPVPIENREFISNRRLLLPLAEDGRTVDCFIALMIGDRKRTSATLSA